MGKLYDSFGNRKSKSWSYKTGIQEQEDLIREYQEVASKKGIEIPSEKPSPSLLEKLLGFVSAGETAPAAMRYLETGSPEEALKKYGQTAVSRLGGGGYGDEATYANVLKKLGMKEEKIIGPVTTTGVTGLALDVLLDPTTYFGGAAIKAGGKYIGKPITRAATKAPVIGKPIQAATKTLEELFVPFARVKRLPGEAGEKYVEKTFKPFAKGLRYEQKQAVEELAKTSLKAQRKFGPDIGRKITEAIETGTKVPGAEKYQDDIAKLLKKIFKEEEKRGLLKEEIPNYVRHLLTPEAREFIVGGGYIAPSYFKPFQIRKTGAGKKRTLLGTIDELNKSFSEKHGFNLFEPDIYKSTAGRVTENLRAIRTHDFIKEVEAKFGLAAPKGAKRALQGGIEYVAFYPKGKIGFYSGKFTPAEDFLRQLSAQSEPIERSFAKVGQMIRAAEAEGVPVSMSKRFRKAAGAYYPTTNEIKVKFFTPDVLLHERGHSWDYMGGKLSKVINKNRTFQKELRTLTEKFYGMPSRQGMAVEKWAVFIDKFIHDPKFVKENAPMFTSYFRKMLKTNWKFKQAYQDSAKTIRLINKQVKDIMPAIKKFDPDLQNIELAIRKAFPEKTFVGVRPEKPILLPKPIAEHLEETSSILTNDRATNEFLKFYDKALGVWKGSVTGYFPAFHGRNFMGGVFNNFIAGVKSPARYLQANKLAAKSDDVIKLAGKEYTYRQLYELLMKRGAIGDQGWLDIMGTIDNVTDKAFAQSFKKVGMTLTDYPRNAMNFVENRLRGSLFIDELAKGKGVDDAVKKVFQYHFDYAPEGLTTFERNVMRRLVPFYTWARNNIPLQIGQIGRQPGKYAGVGKALRTLSGVTGGGREEYQDLPEYMRRSFPIKMSSNAGQVNYLYGLGLPIEDLSNMTVGGMLAKISPLIKVPLELATDRNFYFNTPISEFDTAPQTIQKAPKPIQDLLDYSEEKVGKKTYATVNPIKWHILSNVFGRTFYTMDRLTNKDVTMAVKILYAFLGLKGRAVDIERQRYYSTKETAERLGEFLMGEGAAREFKRIYIPKK